MIIFLLQSISVVQTMVFSLIFTVATMVDIWSVLTTDKVSYRRRHRDDQVGSMSSFHVRFKVKSASPTEYFTGEIVLLVSSIIQHSDIATTPLTLFVRQNKH